MSTLDDACEPRIRHYLRGKSSSHQRIKESIIAGIAALIGYQLVLFLTGTHRPWWAYAIPPVLGFSLIFLKFKDTVAKRIRKYVKKELGHRLPAPTVYDITDTQLRCTFLGVEFGFPLASLSEIKEDDQRLEIWFGDAGLCTIPLRAFRDESHKAEFIRLLEKKGAV